MTWDDIKRKLSSRKFWALLAAFIPPLLVFTGVIDSSKSETMNLLIVQGGACVAYMFAETAIDVARVVKEKKDGESDNEQ